MTPPGASLTRSAPRKSSIILVPSYTGDHLYCNARSYKMSRTPGSASYGTRLRSDRCTRKYSSSTPRRKSLGAVRPDVKGTRRSISARLLAIASTIQAKRDRRDTCPLVQKTMQGYSRKRTDVAWCHCLFYASAVL